jgi:acyl-CoA thioesterase FadM
MYPIFRLALEYLRSGRADPLPLDGEHVSTHRCWPQDIDIFLEMNNGRILTILDLGRTGLARRTGLLAMLRREGWALTLAGSSVRFRKRIRPFSRFTLRTRCVGWDARFMDLDQTIWLGETCAAQALLRAAVTDADGIVTTDRVLQSLEWSGPAPALPDWIENWIAAEATRPWPPAAPIMSAQTESEAA